MQRFSAVGGVDLSLGIRTEHNSTMLSHFLSSSIQSKDR